MRGTGVVGAALLVVLFVQGVGAETVYVSAAATQLRNHKGVSSRVVAQVRRGQALDVLRRDGRWYYVATDKGAQGWIYRYKVSTKPPERGGDTFALLGGSSSRVAMRESSSSSGIRGLNPISERQVRRRGRQDRHIRAVKEMETLRVSAEELQRFLRTGRLGEYQEGN